MMMAYAVMQHGAQCFAKNLQSFFWLAGHAGNAAYNTFHDQALNPALQQAEFVSLHSLKHCPSDSPQDD